MRRVGDADPQQPELEERLEEYYAVTRGGHHGPGPVVQCPTRQTSPQTLPPIEGIGLAEQSPSVGGPPSAYRLSQRQEVPLAVVEEDAALPPPLARVVVIDLDHPVDHLVAGRVDRLEDDPARTQLRHDGV